MATLNLQNLNLPINLKGKSSKSVEAFLKEYTNLTSKQIEELTSLKRGDDFLLNVNSNDNQGFLYETMYLLNSKGYEYTLEHLTKIANDYSIIINANFILETSLFEKEQLDYQKEISRLRDKIENNDIESIVQCGKCKSYSVSYVRAERQRGRDEAEITKYTCNNIACGHSWKN
jgi:DNA-directed RNA polymerase subunit M/transcription elongation factor TFIIS